jgi:hypothetical protein
MVPTIPARSANPSLLEAEVRMGEGRSEGAKAGPYRDFVNVNVKVNESGLPAAKSQLNESGASCRTCSSAAKRINPRPPG